MGDRREPERIGELLGPAGQKLGIQDAVGVGRLWGSWAAIVGPTIAEHARPTSLRDGVLRVRASSPAWATEVEYLSAQIRAQIVAALGTGLVREVRVHTAKGGSERTAQASSRPVSGPVAAVRSEAAEDPLEGLRRAHEAWLARRARGRRPESAGGPSSRRSTC